MSQTQQQTSQDKLQKIVHNMAHMRKEKNCLEVRQVAIRRALKKIERQLATSDDVEEEQNLEDIVDNLFSISSDLESFREHLETDLDKVRRGVESLATIKGKAGWRAFAAYIAEDTELSIQNLTQVHSYYDQVIETIKTLKETES